VEDGCETGLIILYAAIAGNKVRLGKPSAIWPEGFLSESGLFIAIPKQTFLPLYREILQLASSSIASVQDYANQVI